MAGMLTLGSGSELFEVAWPGGGCAPRPRAVQPLIERAFFTEVVG